MRKLKMTMWVTLDGYIAGPNGEMDWIGAIYDAALALVGTSFSPYSWMKGPAHA